MSDEVVDLTVDEALSVLPEGERVHTFRGGGIALIGADWDRPAIERAIRDAGGATLAGGMARSTGHGIAVQAGGWLFVETDETALTALEAARTPA